MSVAEGARRLLSDEESCYNCLYRHVEGKCRREQGKLNPLPTNLHCGGWRKDSLLDINLKTYPVKVKAKKIKANWTKETEQLMSSTLNPCGEIELKGLGNGPRYNSED